MHKKTLHPMYEAESGGAGGAPAPEGTKDPAGDDKAVFTPEQQAKIDELKPENANVLRVSVCR